MLTIIMPPILSGALIAIDFFAGASQGNSWSQLILVWVFGMAPFAIGYAISLRWRKVHPVGYVFLGTGFTVVALFALMALAFVGCGALVLMDGIR